MRKISLLIIILLISIVCPVFASQTIIADNPADNVVDVMTYPEKMVNNYGTVTLINDSGNIENNYGTVTATYGSVSNNYGTIGTIYDKGSVAINEGVIKENNYYVNINNSSGIIEQNNYRVQMNQYGTIENNNSEVWTNFGTIKLNNTKGYIDDNYGRVEENKGTILRNQYSTDDSLVNSVNNTENGTVLENYAQVKGGMIEKNYSKDVNDAVINNNYSNEVGENVTIKRNFANFIDNAIIENQYYKLTVKGNVDFICKIDMNNNVEDNIHIDLEGQTWIKAEDATFEIKPKRGYRIVEETTITTSGATIVNKEDDGNIEFLTISGEITIEVETEEIETYKVVFDANGGEFSDGREIVTYEKWLPEDYEYLENPTRDGYLFLGYFTENDDGVSFDNYYNESGVDQDMILYAHWKEASSSGTDFSQPESSTQQDAGEFITEPQPEFTRESSKTNNPQTGNSIIVWCVVLMFAITGIIITRKKQ